MIAFLAEIRFDRSGDSAAYVAQGWGPQEPGHRWAVGAESHMRLPVARPGPGCVLLLGAMPWCDAVSLPVQTVMLAVNGRLLANVEWEGHRTLAFPLPASTEGDDELTLEIHHLSSRLTRAEAGLSPSGEPFGLLVTDLRVFRLPPPRLPPATRGPVAGEMADGTLQAAVQAATGLAPERLASRFESIGQNCEFGLVQRGLGAEPLGLLRFASVVNHMLVEGLMAGFAGVGRPETTRVFVSDPPDCEYKVHEQTHYLWYSTRRTAAEATQDAVWREQCRRLAFLQRKFVEDLRAGEKVCVLTFIEPGRLSGAEALAVFCALNVHGPNAMLWTVFGDPARAGQVDRLYPGFLLGHLGAVDERGYASWDAWLSVLYNAKLLLKD